MSPPSTLIAITIVGKPKELREGPSEGLTGILAGPEFILCIGAIPVEANAPGRKLLLREIARPPQPVNVSRAEE